MLLSIPISFVATTTILSAAVNSNFSTIASWANGNISNDNIGTLDGALSWTISGNALAVSIGSASTTGVFVTSLTGVLASTKSAFDLQSAAAQTTGRALAYLNLSNASSTIPALAIANSGTAAALSITDTGTTGTSAFDVNSTTKGARPKPRMTTVQRDAISSPPEGLEIFNLTLHQPEYYSGSAWSVSGGGATAVDNATIENNAGTLRIKDGAFSADATGRAKMADGFVNTAKLATGVLSADATGRGKMADGYLSADSTGRAKVADGFVTVVKLAAANRSAVNFSNTSTTSTSPQAVTGGSTSITAGGVRPVQISLQPRSGGGTSYVELVGSTAQVRAVVEISDNQGNVFSHTFESVAGSALATSITMQWPLPAPVSLIPSAGTYTVTLKIYTINVSAGTQTITINDGTLVVSEI